LVEDLDEDYGVEDDCYGSDLNHCEESKKPYEIFLKETAERFAKIYQVYSYQHTGRKIEVEIRDYLPKVPCQDEEETK